MKIEDDKIIFSSGRTAYAHQGIIGLSPDLTISEGYDGGFPWPIYDYMKDDENNLTSHDIWELANYMIKQWTKLKNNLPEDNR